MGDLHQALSDPVWPLCLGRKAFVPGEAVWLEDGLRVGVGLEEALRDYPSLGNKPIPSRRLVMEDDDGREVRPDQPISFARREFGLRRVRTTFLTTPIAEQADRELESGLELEGDL